MSRDVAVCRPKFKKMCCIMSRNYLLRHLATIFATFKILLILSPINARQQMQSCENYKFFCHVTNCDNPRQLATIYSNDLGIFATIVSKNRATIRDNFSPKITRQIATNRHKSRQLAIICHNFCLNCIQKSRDKSQQIATTGDNCFTINRV